MVEALVPAQLDLITRLLLGPAKHRRAWQTCLMLVLAHGWFKISVHVLRVFVVFLKLLKEVPLWAPPLQIYHLIMTFIRVAVKRLTGFGHRERWSLLAELFIETLRPMEIFKRNFEITIAPAMRCITLLDAYGEQFARACHPRLQLEHVTQGCPRPMTWVWFDSNSTQRKRGGASKQGQDAAGATQSHELVLYFLHGGGYWLFTGKSHIEYVARLVKVMGSQGISIKACVIDHRRAPEHPWPAPLDDAIACYEWLQKGAGYQPSQIVLSGDSAGGGLSLCLLTALRDSLKALPLCALLVSPLTDLSRTREQYPAWEGVSDFLPLEAIEASRKQYVQGEDPKHPLISPKYGSLHALPPILMQAGENELLVKDSIECSRRLEAYGGVVQLELYPEMPHIFPMLAPLGLEDARAAILRQAEFINEVREGQEELRGKKVKVLVHDKRTRSFEDLPVAATSKAKLPLAVSSPDVQMVAGSHSKHKPSQRLLRN